MFQARARDLCEDCGCAEPLKHSAYFTLRFMVVSLAFNSEPSPQPAYFSLQPKGMGILQGLQ